MRLQNVPAQTTVSKALPKLFMVMYSPDRIPDNSSVVVYSLTVEKGKGKFSLNLIHCFHNPKPLQTPLCILAPTSGVRTVMYFKHKGRLQIFEAPSVSRKKSAGYHRVGGLAHFVAGYFYEQSSAIAYGRSIFQKVCDDKLKNNPLRELNRASILRRLFADKCVGIVLNQLDLNRIIKPHP